MIDPRLPTPWPPEAVEAARGFRQGYVLERPPFFYWRSERWPLWQMVLPAVEAKESVVYVEDEDRPAYGLITSHTCDLYEDGNQRQPWFAVAPVYDLGVGLDAGQLNQLRRGQIGHLVLLTASWLVPGNWVADLRIEYPLEKGLLVGRPALDGFASQGEYETLARRLASRRGRPALSGALTEHLVRKVRDWLKTDGANGGRRYRDEIHSLRLRVVGDPVTSSTAQLVVVTDDQPLTATASASMSRLEGQVLDAAARNGVVLLPFMYRTLDQLTAREVETSIRLDYDYMSPET